MVLGVGSGVGGNMYHRLNWIRTNGKTSNRVVWRFKTKGKRKGFSSMKGTIVIMMLIKIRVFWKW